VNDNISRRSSIAVQHRESTNLVFGSVKYCRLNAVVPRAQMNKAASTSRVCSGVFITRLLLRCTPSQLASYIQDTCGGISNLKTETKYDCLQFILCQMCALSENHFWPTGVTLSCFMIKASCVATFNVFCL